MSIEHKQFGTTVKVKFDVSEKEANVFVTVPVY